MSGSYLPDIHRMLPQAADSEQGTLCSMILSAEAFDSAVEKGVRAEWFHIPAHSTIFTAIQGMRDERMKIDVVTLTQWLRDRKTLDQIGGAAYVADICTFLPTAANLGFYLKILEDKFILRQLINGCTEIAARAYDEQDNVSGLVDEAQEKIMAIAAIRYGIRDDYETSAEVVMQAVQSIETMQGKEGCSGLSTGYPEVDHITDGLKNGEMIVIAARPSMGKTALAMNIAEHISVAQKLPVAVFSLEMSKQQLVQRMILSRARINWQKFREGTLGDEAYPAIAKAANQLGTSPIHWCDKSPMTMSYLAAVSRRWKKKFGIRAIVIDYLQLLRGAKTYKGDNREKEVSEVSSGIKNLAKELDVPIVVLAQLSRKPDDRTGSSRGRPQLSDLRESGSIEQDADIVGLLVREEYYATNDEEKKESEGKATLIIAKQRNGPVGDVPLTFIKEFTRFESRARCEEPELVHMPPPPKKKKSHSSYHH